jgi:hypothetical protein
VGWNDIFVIRPRANLDMIAGERDVGGPLDRAEGR